MPPGTRALRGRPSGGFRPYAVAPSVRCAPWAKLINLLVEPPALCRSRPGRIAGAFLPASMVIPRLATLRRIPAVAALLLLLPVAAAAQITPAVPNPKPMPSVTLAPIEVIGTSPLLGVGIDRDKVPSNVQTLPAPNIEMQGPAGLVNDLDQEL